MSPQEISLINRAEADLENIKRYLNLANTEHDTNGDFRTRAKYLMRQVSGSVNELQNITKP
jgi:hypothetical protein